MGQSIVDAVTAAASAPISRRAVAPVAAVTLPVVVVVWLAELIALQRSGGIRWLADLAAGPAILAALMSLAMVFAGGFSDQKAVS